MISASLVARITGIGHNTQLRRILKTTALALVHLTRCYHSFIEHLLCTNPFKMSFLSPFTITHSRTISLPIL
jgi:hypothetical protein